MLVYDIIIPVYVYILPSNQIFSEKYVDYIIVALSDCILKIFRWTHLIHQGIGRQQSLHSFAEIRGLSEFQAICF